MARSLPTLRKVQKLQAALHAKAKGSPGYRFYALYDKVHRADVLAEAYEQCRKNGGAAGVDGQRFEDIEAYGLEQWRGELAPELRGKRYRPQAVRRGYSSKPNGKPRPWGIPPGRARVVQPAAVLVVEPIFEADLPPEQSAYRAHRNAWDAVGKVHSLVNTGQAEVVDADLSGYFDSIPHAELLKSVARRVSDRHLLHLIKLWLEAPVEEIDERGRHHRTTRNKDERGGTPQGAPISPLLSNLEMRRFVLGWKVLGHAQRLRADIVNYADAFVSCCRGTARQAMAAMRQLRRTLKLPVNEEKTRQGSVWDDAIDVLGYTSGRGYSPKTGKMYIGTKPSQQKIGRRCREIRELTEPRWLLIDTGEHVARINRRLRGGANYFRLGPVSQAYHAVERHTASRLRRWLRRKHKVQGRATARSSDEYLSRQLKL